MATIDIHQVVGRANILFVTFDCLRYDVARRCWEEGTTPHLARLLPADGWEPRETPGTFTLAAHLAFFHGFLPTPLTLPSPPAGGEGKQIKPSPPAGGEGKQIKPSPPAGGEGRVRGGNATHPRLFALEFEGSLTIGPGTYMFAGVDNILAGFRRLGYRTFCVGGVGFFNKRNPLGRVLPGFFAESVWHPSLGVTARDSTAAQVRAALDWLETVAPAERLLLFINVSATHPPHAHYLPGTAEDCPASQAAALAYVDSRLPPLLEALRRRGECFCLFMADHGEAYGEDGRWGHRLAHPTVTTVPYAHFFL